VLDSLERGCVCFDPRQVEEGRLRAECDDAGVVIERFAVREFDATRRRVDGLDPSRQDVSAL
jgi:hypothetical protein